MSENLDKALNNIQTQLDKKAEAKRKAEEAKRKAAEEEREQWNKKQKMAERFPEAIKENQVEEVKSLLQQNVERGRYHYDVFSFPSTEMAEIIINDMRQVLAGDRYTSSENKIADCICKTIYDHPEHAAKWDQFAKKHDISYHFATTDKKVLDKVIEQGFDVQCFDFERAVKSYYGAKNGYIATEYYGPHDDYSRDFWVNQDPQKATQIKKDLIYVLSRGYQIDLSNNDSKSYLFMQELLKERELQKQGADKSFVYRDPSEKFYDHKSGECRLSMEELKILTGRKYYKEGLAEGRIENGEFSGSIISTPHGGKKAEAQYKEGKLHGVYKELNSDGTVHAQKYYENGVDVTEKHKALKKIAERRIAKEEKLSTKKGKPVILKKMNNIQKALALKKAQKESER